MSDFQRKSSMDNYRRDLRPQGGQKKRYKDTRIASLKDFDIPIGSWEQTAHERSKWRGLYEEKRICEAKR